MNMVDEQRDRDLIVTYDYPASAGYRKPLTLVVGMVGLFVGVWAFSKMDTTISVKK